ncbi:tetratricopeptide repeat protein [Acidovorax radicis]|uniref:tetratricopeptide repeat protein n=1 Tax=Acidovorax radicis TaxID=758826 RepID=UPI001111C8F7|nr:SEL1-like repeat protein [Acidovorax radicis]
MTNEDPASQAELLRAAVDSYETDRMSIALTQFLELAKSDCEEAFLYLSLIFRDGDGVEKDELAAVRYKRRYVQIIESRATAGIAEYRLKLAYLLQFGDGAPVDNSRAFSLFLQLAEEGCAEAQFHLSRIFAHGDCGQKRDSDLELYWLNEAVKAEWPLAIYYAALFLENTSDAAESRRHVKEMMRKSSQLGCWQAEEYLNSNP